MAFLSLVALVGSVSAALPEPEEIFDRMRHKYDFAKTYQGEMHATMHRQGEVFTSIAILKSENDGSGHVRRGQGSYTVSHTVNGKESRTNQFFVDDGTTLYEANLVDKTYTKRPHISDHVFGAFETSVSRVRQRFDDLFEVTVAKETGKLVFVLSHDSPLGKARILVDAKTYALVRMTSTVGTKDKKIVSEVWTEREIFDRKIPEAAFRWTPPSGFRVGG